MIIEMKIYMDTEKEGIDVGSFFNFLENNNSSPKQTTTRKLNTAKKLKKEAEELKAKAEEIEKEEISPRTTAPATKKKTKKLEQEKLAPIEPPPQVEGEKVTSNSMDVIDVTPTVNDANEVSTLPPRQVLTQAEELNAEELQAECQKISLSSIKAGCQNDILKLMDELGITSLGSTGVTKLAQFKEMAIKIIETATDHEE